MKSSMRRYSHLGLLNAWKRPRRKHHLKESSIWLNVSGVGGEEFYQRTMKGLEEAGYDTNNPFEMLLALRRIGAAELERAFGPGEVDTSGYYGRAPWWRRVSLTSWRRKQLTSLEIWNLRLLKTQNAGASHLRGNDGCSRVREAAC